MGTAGLPSADLARDHAAGPAARTLSTWLGLPAGAAAEDVASAYDELLSHLDAAPAGLEGWARATRAEAIRLREARDREAATKATGGAGPREQDPATGDGADLPTDLAADLAGGHFDEDDFLTDDRPARATGRRRRARAAAGSAASETTATRPPRGTAATSPAPAGAARSAGAGRRRPVVAAGAGADAVAGVARPRGVATVLVPLLVVLLVASVIYGVYATGRPAATTPAAGGAPTTVALNQAKVDELTAKAKADPQDVAALRGLTDEYYAVGDYAKAAQWQAKVVALQPKDVPSRLVYAAALANSGDSATAEKEWLTVTELDAKQAEAYYNLGILHFSANPPQTDKARAEWRKVVEIDPNSDLAKNVTSHLDRMTGATSTAPATK